MKKHVGFEQGEIVKVDLDPSIGHEQKGYRPVLVLTNSTYNRLTGVPVVAAITSGGLFARHNGLTVSLEGHNLQTTGFVRCDQIRAMDLTSRNAKRIETVPDIVLEDVLMIVSSLFEKAE